MGKLAIALILTPALYAQVDRVFHLTKVTTPTALEEIATTLRTVGSIQQVSIDAGLATLTVNGSAEQIAFAEWLVPKLDVTDTSNFAPQEYQVAGNPSDIAAVFALEHTAAATGLQEIITTLRTVANIQKVYNVTATKIITLRGNANDIALAKFLISELDQAPQVRPNPTIHEFGDTVIVYGLAHIQNNIGLQEIITNLRSVLNIQKIYTASNPKLLAMRATPAELQSAEWLIAELDRPAANPGTNELRLPGGNDDVMHVFYLTHTTSNAGISGLLASVRSTTHIMKAYQRSMPAALVLRGTADQIAMAGRMIELSDQPTP